MEIGPQRGYGQTVDKGGVLGSALQTDLQGKTGTMLKSADDTHVQLLPSRC